MNPDFGVIFIHFILLFLQSFYCIHFSTHLMHPIHPAKLLSLIIWRKATVQYLYARFASTKEIEKQKAMGNSAVQQYPLKQKAAVTLPESMIAPKYRLSQRKLVCQPSSFRCYVSFRECKGSNKKRHGISVDIRKRNKQHHATLLSISSSPSWTWSESIASIWAAMTNHGLF